MPIFTYRATARDGSLFKGTITAIDRSAAFRELDARKLQALALIEDRIHTSNWKSALGGIRRSRPAEGVIRLKPGDVLHFTEEFSELLGGGIPVEQSLGILERRDSKSRIAKISGMIRAKLRDGNPLSASLQTSSPDFGSLYCGLVAAGEESGALCQVLRRQAGHLKAILELRSRVIFALIYPAFLSVSAIAVSALFVVFLIPKLMELLDSTGGTLPVAARFMINVGDFAKGTWYIWLGLLITAGIFGHYLAASKPLEWNRLLMKLPTFGRVLQSRQHVQFLETMSSLIGNGLTITNALALTKSSTVSPVFREEIEAIRGRVADGESLSSCLGRSVYFPPLMSDLVAIGEHTGELAAALERAAERFDADLRRGVERLSAIIQPTVVLLMALIVGTVAYLMISAIFQTMSGMAG